MPTPPPRHPLTPPQVYEPLAWLLKALVRHGLIPIPFLHEGTPAGGGLAQRRATLLFHTLNGMLLYVATYRLLALRRDLQARGRPGSPQATAISDVALKFGAAAGATLWMCHPLRAEVVGWASAQVTNHRSDVNGSDRADASNHPTSDQTPIRLSDRSPPPRSRTRSR